MNFFLNLLLPHFFTKEPIPAITNPDLQAVITKLKQVRAADIALKQALTIIADRYDSKRFETYLAWYKFYEKNPNILWQRTGFMHCTHQNYLLRVLLVKSGWIPDDDIELGFSLVWYISPHQFLKIRLPNGKWIAVDPWNFTHGAKYGYHAIGFGIKQLD